MHDLPVPYHLARNTGFEYTPERVGQIMERLSQHRSGRDQMAYYFLVGGPATSVFRWLSESETAEFHRWWRDNPRADIRDWAGWNRKLLSLLDGAPRRSRAPAG